MGKVRREIGMVKKKFKHFMMTPNNSCCRMVRRYKKIGIGI